MKIIINENIYRLLIENRSIDNILDKLNSGDKLSIDDKRCLQKYSEFLSNGGSPSDFKCPSDEYDIDEREGMEFKAPFDELPLLKFTFSEESSNNDETHYFGELIYGGDEYLGIIAADDNGYLVDYDFYDVNDENGKRFQEVDEYIKPYVNHFFSEIVIPKLMNAKK